MALLKGRGVAAIKPKFTARPSKCRASPSLLALTSAALALPGLMLPPAHAAFEGGEFNFQYGRYEEGGGTQSQFRNKDNDIQVDSLETSGEIDLTDRLRFRANFIQDTWVGATPITTAPAAAVRFNPNAQTGASPFFDLRGGVVNFDIDTGQGSATIPGTFESVITAETVHVMAEASPETRKQGDFNLSYEWDEAALDLGGGISLEDDYESRYFSLGGRWDFNQKLTTLTGGVGYINSTIDALRFPFRVTSVPVDPEGEVNPDFPDWSVRVNDRRTDTSVNLGLTQVLDKNSVFKAGFGYTHSSGFLSNVYKESVFFVPLETPGMSWLFTRYDKRPEEREQFNWNIGYSRYLAGLDAALHFNYNFFHDDWGINAHTFDVSWGQPIGGGWTITPTVRYYSQSAADFYSPFFIVDQGPFSVGEILANQSQLPTPDHFSSDHRLSAFGALSGGVTLSKQFAKGVTLEAGFEYYTHAGSLKLGGGGTGDFADFNYFLANALLKVDLSALSHSGGGYGEHEHPSGHAEHSDYAPAGVMFDHMLKIPGHFMVGYRYRYSRHGGDTLHGAQAVNDLAIVNNACGDNPCQVTSEHMNMHMHMLDLMYAPTDWLNVMLMPMFMDMDMGLRELEGAPPPDPDAVGGHSHAIEGGGHATGGLGDTRLFALVKLLDSPRHHLHLGLGISAPTGDVDIKVEGMEINENSPDFGKPLFLHYGMQLGSGTWDFLPNLTYTGGLERWSWGGQLSGTLRLESENSSGFSFGDIFQATAWGGYSLFNWLSASVRGIYTIQGGINGQFNGPTPNSAPVDFPDNYGGRFWDVGFGLNASTLGGGLKGNRLSFEWIQPVRDDVNGFQLEREGTLFVTWDLAF
ncbi:conserved hypothetical protein [Nitrosococcus halophilus Nc 4]|uniref:Lipoprotein n=1 Tax=Nitrosococcus halophilus (strain Nc4) TaxID=472759 RepID=D5BWL1_NITHN|nr:conserved hypothetical protein [Nitrosococcus halophilus Nc 4]